MKSQEELRQRLQDLHRAWGPETYRSMLHFYVEMLPRLFDCGRCGIFVVDPDTRLMRSVAGTQLREGEVEVSLHDSFAGKAAMSGDVLIDNRVQRAQGAHAEVSEQTGYYTRSILCCPLLSGADASVIGVVQLINKADERGFDVDDSQWIKEAARYLSLAIESLQIGKDLLDINDQLSSELDGFRKSARRIVAENQVMRNVLRQATDLAPMPVRILVTGENGTGKEQIASLIHRNSPRSAHPFIAINCASIPETLFESELFGYEKGAFTGAQKSQPGKFEAAAGGTLFLDEVGELPMQVQAKLLRALQENEGQRLGSDKIRKYDFRLVCATNRDLQAMIEQGLFREDLYYRLFSVRLHLPPLRERPEDILALTQFFVEQVSAEFGKTNVRVSKDILKVFERYPWPGNVRQLRREVERLVALTPDGSPLDVEMCSDDVRTGGAQNRFVSSLHLPQAVADLEKRLIAEALSKHKNNKSMAADELGLSRPGLYKKMARYQM